MVIIKNNRHLLIFIFFAFVLYSCATARSVLVEPGKGGIVVVSPRNSNEARAKASDIMRRTCGGKPYRIVKEEEVVIGTVTRTQRHTDVDVYKKPKRIMTTSYRDTTTSTRTQWEITYRCR
jgi:hypothetical protein